MTEHTPLYQLENLTQRYGARTVLQVAALQIQRGETLALVGPSGAGKSTLLRLLALLEHPTQGALTLQLGDGQHCDSRSATLAQRRRLAMVFQQPALTSRSVWRNVAYGLSVRGIPDAKPRALALLESVGLAHVAHLPARTLSGGERQRVALARALIVQPEVLFLDEPTANLDPANIHRIESILEEANPRPTVIIVTHNIFQARRVADRAALLLDGQLVEVADVATFFEQPQDPRTAAFIRGEMVY